MIINCFLHEFFWQNSESNFLKGKASYKGNVKIRFIFLDQLLCFHPKKLSHNVSVTKITYFTYIIIASWIYSYFLLEESSKPSHNGPPKQSRLLLAQIHFPHLPQLCSPLSNCHYTGLHCSFYCSKILETTLEVQTLAATSL